jgi:hypothetical protein
MCACGQPLHYSDPDTEFMVRELVRDLGENVIITTSQGVFHVPRHYIALHGIKEQELPALAQKYGWRRVP